MIETSWATLSEARSLWKSAPADDGVLTAHLEAVKPALIAFAPANVEASLSAETIKMAHVMQARNLFNAGQSPVRQGDSFDGSGFGVSVFPLDWQVQQLLRPQRGLGAIA